MIKKCENNHNGFTYWPASLFVRKEIVVINKIIVTLFLLLLINFELALWLTGKGADRKIWTELEFDYYSSFFYNLYF